MTSLPEQRRLSRIKAIHLLIASENTNADPSSERRVIDLCKKLTNEHIFILGKCFTFPIFKMHISNITKFLPNFDQIVSQPYKKDLFGEQLEDCGALAVRDVVMMVLKDVLCSANAHAFTAIDAWKCPDQHLDLTRHRLDFYLWLFWQHKQSVTYVPHKQLQTYLTHFPEISVVSEQKVEQEELWQLALRHHILVSAPKHKDSGQQLLTHRTVHECEILVHSLLTGATELHDISVSDALTTLDMNQRCVVQNALSSPVFIVQGGAGVGKTTTMAGVVESLASSLQGQHLEPSTLICCLAFTHKAKKCLLERLHLLPNMKVYLKKGCIRVSTIHSFVQSIKMTDSSHEYFVILDEASMIDVELMAELGKALKNSGARYQLCMVGDASQLPPVGRGEVFRTLLQERELGNIRVANLTHCYRTDDLSLYNAYCDIRDGCLPANSASFVVQLYDHDQHTMYRIRTLAEAIAFDKSKAVGQATIPEKSNNTRKSRLCIPVFITWQNKDVSRINEVVQTCLLKHHLVGPERCGEFCKGDSVMYVGDNETEGVDNTSVPGALTNATLGVVVHVQTGSDTTGNKQCGQEMTVIWETEQGPVLRVHKMSSKCTASSSIRDIRLAYCLTVHKSQGSEYNEVVVACFDVPKLSKCLDRRWLYTAASRGKQKVTMLATHDIYAFLKRPVRPTCPLFL